MPSIRDLVAAIRQRDGVDAAVVLGRDGLLIDGQLIPGLDARSSLCCSGVVSCGASFSIPAMRPISVCIPVDTTKALPRP